MGKKISVYLQSGEKAAVTYYRFYQFFSKMNVDVRYQLMIPEERRDSFLPISKQPIFKKICIFIYIYIRVFIQLISDFRDKPDILIISRRLIHRIMPFSFLYLLKKVKERGCKIVWDYDDQIINLGEVTRRGFNQLSNVSDIIIVGSPFLKELLLDKYKGKAILLPTTDGDMNELLNDEVTTNRIQQLSTSVKIVWVGTFSGLDFLKQITPAFEEFGKYLILRGRELRVSVVCDYPLEYDARAFVLENIPWERKIAVKKMLDAHIGVMPLEDNEIARGKCGFKLIQYLSIGLPVVGSAVGMNKQIISKNVGVAIDTLNPESWNDAFMTICSSPSSWRNYSLEAQKKWHDDFSYDKNLDMWKRLLM